MKKKIMREVTVTFCDYCGAELTNFSHGSIELKDGVVKDFCSTYSEGVDETCLDKFKIEEIERLKSSNKWNGKYLSLDQYRDDKDKLKRHELSEKDKIDNVVQQIMIEYGPDGHCDGSDVIAQFIIKLISCSEEKRKELLKSVELEDFI